MIASFDDSLGTPPLAEAIDRHPLIVAPDTCLLDGVTLMYETAKRSHQLFRYQASGSLPTQLDDSLWGRVLAACW